MNLSITSKSDMKHKSKYVEFQSQFRQNKIDSSQKLLEGQQNVYKKCKEHSSELVKTSLHVS